MTRLEYLSPSQTNTTGTTCMVLDGAAIKQMMKPAAVKTYDEYAQEVFIPYISSQLRSVSRVDLVWDTYKHDSLKDISRVKHDKGVRRRMDGNGKGNQETGRTFWGLTATRQNYSVSCPMSSSRRSVRKTRKLSSPMERGAQHTAIA